MRIIISNIISGFIFRYCDFDDYAAANKEADDNDDDYVSFLQRIPISQRPKRLNVSSANQYFLQKDYN